MKPTCSSSGGQIGSGVKLQIVPTVLLADMSVDEATGIIQPEIDATKTSVEISNLPDFLNDDETSLSVSNPVILFSAVNPLNAPVDLTGKMLGKKKTEPLSAAPKSSSVPAAQTPFSCSRAAT